MFDPRFEMNPEIEYWLEEIAAHNQRLKNCGINPAHDTHMQEMQERVQHLLRLHLSAVNKFMGYTKEDNK
ncbi:hypothetical protein [Vibrio cholerae]|uniref:hypothetical protein n=1 Tax=Vibrio cholerae TaxID=666 RepID=UPI000E6A7DF5|nr:hypothetical protein [Vibrio cholerae]